MKLRKALLFTACCVLASYGVGGTVTMNSTQNDLSHSKAGCDSPFVLVRDQCFLIDSLSSGTWYEMRQICQTFATDMAMIKSADLLGDLVEIIYALGEDNVDYFIGATDEDHEGNWRWVDSTAVRMGMPAWFFYESGVQEPNGGTTYNCLHMRHQYGFYFFDGVCGGTASVICEKQI